MRKIVDSGTTVDVAEAVLTPSGGAYGLEAKFAVCPSSKAAPTRIAPDIRKIENDVTRTELCMPDARIFQTSENRRTYCSYNRYRLVFEYDYGRVKAPFPFLGRTFLSFDLGERLWR